MKYLQITKDILTTGEHMWLLFNRNFFNKDIKNPSYCKTYSNTIIEKVEDYLHGKTKIINHNKNKFEVEKSIFTRGNKPVYFVLKVGSNEPWIFYSYDEYNKVWVIDPIITIDEDIELFNKYGYVEHRY